MKGKDTNLQTLKLQFLCSRCIFWHGLRWSCMGLIVIGVYTYIRSVLSFHWFLTTNSATINMFNKSYWCLVVQDRSSSQYPGECPVECKGEPSVVQKYLDLPLREESWMHNGVQLITLLHTHFSLNTQLQQLPTSLAAPRMQNFNNAC